MKLDSYRKKAPNTVEGNSKYSDNIVMNTMKILDVVPQATPVQTQQPGPPPRTPPRAVQPIGDGAASDAIRQNAQREADAAAAEADRMRAAPKAQHHSFDREVGFVGDSFQVFIDLVSPALQSQRFRIFGPPDSQAPLPPPETDDPASAHAAYNGAPAAPPVLKTDV
jgi:hypothetical protein